MVNGRFGQVGIPHAPTDVEKELYEEPVSVIVQHPLMEEMSAQETRFKRNRVHQWTVQVIFHHLFRMNI